MRVIFFMVRFCSSIKYTGNVLATMATIYFDVFERVIKYVPTGTTARQRIKS